MFGSLSIAFLPFILARSFEAKIFERCEFANIMVETNFFAYEDLGKFTCIASWASGLNSSKESQLPNEKRRYGIMQIDDYHGCGEGEFSWCDLPCEEFLNEELRNDLRCTVVLDVSTGSDGWEGWPEWEEYCEGHDLSPYVDGCFEHRFPVIESPQNAVLNRSGIDEKITCNVTGDPTLNITWSYNTTKYPTAYSLEIPPDQESGFTLTHLIFPTVDSLENDIFICIASNVYAEVNETFYVSVMQEPIIKSQTCVQFRLTHENQTMSCNATGYPAPHLKWIYDKTLFPNLITRINEENIDFTSIALVFPNVKFETAEFVCEASNQHGSVSETFSVTIKEPPQITIPTDNTFYTQDRNQSISCTALGYPIPSLRWEYNKTQFPDLFIECGPDDPGDYLSTLKLIFPEADFETEYFVCIALNKYDQDRETFEVTVVNKPPPQQPKIPPYNLIPIGIVAVAIFITLTLIFYRKYLLKNYQLTDDEIELFKNGVPSKLHKYLYQSGSGEAMTADIFHYLPYDKEYELKHNELKIKIDTVLGNGNFGVVFEGECRGKKVAVKVPKGEPNKITNLKNLLTEIKVIIHIGEHLHVVNLIGAITKKLKQGELYVAVDYCELGDLEQYLRNNKPYFEDPSLPTDYISGGALTSESENKGSIKYLDLLRWSAQIASGMAHLEKMKVIHGDLATRNILLYSKEVAKVSDFGLSKKLYSQLEYVSTGESQILPWRWMAIESLTSFSFCSKSDVWSFGVTLWEIFSLGEVPYPGLSWSQEFPVLLREGMRLVKPAYASQKIYEIMLNCWKVDNHSRPDFPSLYDSLLYLQHDVEYPSWRINMVPEESDVESGGSSTSAESESDSN